MNIKQITRIALGVAFLTVCTYLSVPLTISFTMQTFGLFLVLQLFGGKIGTVAVFLYLCLGGIGIPVFAGFRGGIDVLAGPTGGYLWGFVLSALFYWLLEKRLRALPLLILGNGICYFFGTLWFVFFSAGNGNPVSVIEAITLCVLPYILPDAGKLILSLIVAKRLTGLPLFRK